jgi:hypothetical protein
VAAETGFNGAVISKQSVDFPAMTAGVATATVTIQGADPGDAVLVTKPDAAIVLNDIELSGFCATADTVTVIAFSQDTAATTNLAAVTLTFVVFT